MRGEMNEWIRKINEGNFKHVSVVYDEKIIE